MSWKLFASTFVTIFLAELGDKTQLTALSVASASPSRWTVFAASACALTATSAIAVFGGDLIGRYVSPLWLRRVAGAAFVVLGLFFLLRPAEGG